MWYGTFEILYRIRQKINYHKYRRVPQKNKIRKKNSTGCYFLVKTMFSHKKKTSFWVSQSTKKLILDAEVMKCWLVRIKRPKYFRFFICFMTELSYFSISVVQILKFSTTMWYYHSFTTHLNIPHQLWRLSNIIIK